MDDETREQFRQTQEQFRETPEQFRETFQALVSLIENVKESFEREMDQGFSEVRREIALLHEKFDRQDARLSRHAGC